MRSTVALVASLALAATSCSLIGEGDDDSSDGADKVVLVTHDSFSLPDKLVAAVREGLRVPARRSPGG